MATIDVTTENLEETLENNDIVILELYAPWCGHCRQYTPVFRKVSDDHTDVVFGLVNADANKDIPRRFKLAGVPTTIGFKGGKVVQQKPGGMSDETLTEFLEAVKASE